MGSSLIVIIFSKEASHPKFVVTVRLTGYKPFGFVGVKLFQIGQSLLNVVLLNCHIPLTIMSLGNALGEAIFDASNACSFSPSQIGEIVKSTVGNG